MLRSFRSRVEDATFELNLAPMLDIIVSIVPMLLLSVVFVQITMIETPVPQPVKNAMAEADKKDETQIVLALTANREFKITVTNLGKTQDRIVAPTNSNFDLEKLHKEIVALKQQYPNIFRLELHPDESIPLTDLVATMDKIRNRQSGDAKIYFKDVETGKDTETELLFPDIVFGNVMGG